MVVFLAGREAIQLRALHRRITNRFQSDGRFDVVRFRIAEPREPGPYRVVASTDPRVFLDDASYPVEKARIEVGFELVDRAEYEHYWFNWIEPERTLLLGWHQDDDHEDLGPVHRQVNRGDTAVDHSPARFVDEHPMAVVEARLEQLPSVIDEVGLCDDEPPDVKG